MLSHGQQPYSLAVVLGRQNTNITVGQLTSKCPSLQRELRASISCRKRKEIAAVEAYRTEKMRGDLRSPQVEAIINGCVVRGCMIDGGAAINVIASWFMDKMGLVPSLSSSIRLKAVNLRSIRSLEQVTSLPVTVNGVTVPIDLQILEISEGHGDYSIILGRPWLRKVKAVSYWENGQMKIGPHMNRVKIEVIPQESEESSRCESPENSSDYQTDSSWSSGSASESDTSDSETEVEVFALEGFPQMLTESLSISKPIGRIPRESLLSMVKFGPTLSEEEKHKLEELVVEFSEIFVNKHIDLPAITIEEHHIDLVADAIPVRCRQKQMAPDKMSILKEELDRLLAGGFIIPVHNTQWVSPIVIVPKKGNKWRVCVNYRALNKVTKKDRQPVPFIDQLLDEVAGHELLSFCDGYAGYHQVQIAEEDRLKTTFTSPWGTFAYVRMPFG
jgi:hypothetical protein